MYQLSQEQKIHHTLRVAVAMCFIGHGAFGIITKPIWCNYFAVFGIGHDLAYRLMPLLGSLDVILGMLMLFFPMRIILVWLILWGSLTAMLRPLSGEPVAEFIERAGNFGAPLALLILSGSGGKQFKGWFKPINPNVQVNAETMRKMVFCLRIIVFLLLIGHGWLNWIEKKSLLSQYSSFGFSNPVNTAKAIGIFEFIAAISVILRPVRPLVLAFFIWKMGTELFYPHYAVFEWVERGASYGAILALWFALKSEPGQSYVLAK